MDVMNELEKSRLAELLNAVLHAMTTELGPSSLERRLLFELDERGMVSDASAAISHLVADMISGNPNSIAFAVFSKHLRLWDAVTEAPWVEGTLRLTEERRLLVCRKLKLEQRAIDRLSEVVPIAKGFGEAILIASEHESWYSPQRKLRSGRFYWTHYENYLREAAHWDEVATSALDEATDKVVRCLSDPERQEAYPVRGLVVGYVQSGKTANFTAVVAKAVDAGYRLVIVLAGVLDSLRFQTQRRLDKELGGKEQIERDKEDGQAHEYSGDQDWNRFISYGDLPSALGAVDLRRITTSKSDYQKLGQGKDVLRLERPFPDRALNHFDNLRCASARIVVIKKHPAVIKKLMADLKGLGAGLDDVPVLVIDDESDQASVNTVNPRKKRADGQVEKDRTSTNKAIVDLVGMFPRSQYIGYTATPAANTLINPADAEDLFPRDFIELLPRPDNYMGVSDFHDFDADFNPLEPEDVERRGDRSNKKDYVRAIGGRDDEKDLKTAIDAFFLTGAIKLFRADQNQLAVNVRHHTMLVHRSVQTDVQEIDRARVVQLWQDNGYRKKSAIERLWKLWKSDFEEVSVAREPDLARPQSIAELEPFLNQAFVKFESARKQVLIVNGRDDNRDDMPDFDKEDVWNILVGGAKLSRGYTVEGLTITYFLRKAAAADTLMQMGRWFGFRRGYRDLVRLFIGTQVPAGKRATADLYEMFESICMDEERFRKRIAVYSRESGIKPRDVPPLVPMGMLVPTQKNKMYNAQIDNENFGGRVAESGRVTFKPSDRERNVRALGDLLSEGLEWKEFLGRSATGQVRKLDGLIYRLDPEPLLKFLASYRWGTKENQFGTVIRFLQGVGKESPCIDSWVVAVLTKPSADNFWKFGSEQLGAFSRGVVGERFKVFSELRHREVAAHLAMLSGLAEPNESLVEWTRPRQAVCLVYPTVVTGFDRSKVSDSEINLGMSLTFPKNNNPKIINWRVRDPGSESVLVNLQE